MMAFHGSATVKPPCKTKEIADFWSFDALKFFLAILVVVRHCAQSFFSADSLFYIAVVNIISPVAVPTFFALSGFLLFRKHVTFQRVFHQIKRTLKLYIVWSLIYFPLAIYSAWQTTGMSVGKFLITYIQKFLFLGSHYHLWFLPALAFSLLFVWLLDKYVSQRMQLIIVSVLFILGAFAENFTFILPTTLSSAYRMYCQVFFTTRNGLFFGSLFVWIGKYFSRNYSNLEYSKYKKCCMCMFPALLILILEGLILSKINENFVGNMLFSAVPIVFLLMQLSITLPALKQCKKATKQLREASTFLFCFHPIAILAIGFFQKIGISLSRVTSMVVVIIICTICTSLYSKIASKIRILQLLV